jgi:hypothetical protein
MAADCLGRCAAALGFVLADLTPLALPD